MIGFNPWPLNLTCTLNGSISTVILSVSWDFAASQPRIFRISNTKNNLVKNHTASLNRVQCKESTQGYIIKIYLDLKLTNGTIYQIYIYIYK